MCNFSLVGEKSAFTTCSGLNSVTELLHYMALLESLVFTCVIHSGLIKSQHLEKPSPALAVEAFSDSQRSKQKAIGQDSIRTAGEMLHIKHHLWGSVELKRCRNLLQGRNLQAGISRVLFIVCHLYLLFLLFHYLTMSSSVT